MPTYQENLITARDNLAAQIAEATANPRATYSLDGQSFSWSDWIAMLTDQLAKVNRLIGPSQVVSRGRF